MGITPTDRSDEHARTLLVVGGAGGDGSMAIQIAHPICGLRVIATASRAESAAWRRKLGADAVTDHTKPRLAQLREVGDDGVDLVRNTAQPTQNLPQVLEVVRAFGHVCGIVAPSGPLDLGPLFCRRGHLSFESMFTRPLFPAAPGGDPGAGHRSPRPGGFARHAHHHEALGPGSGCAPPARVGAPCWKSSRSAARVRRAPAGLV